MKSFRTGPSKRERVESELAKRGTTLRNYLRNLIILDKTQQEMADDLRQATGVVVTKAAVNQWLAEMGFAVVQAYTENGQLVA